MKINGWELTNAFDYIRVKRIQTVSFAVSFHSYLVQDYGFNQFCGFYDRDELFVQVNYNQSATVRKKLRWLMNVKSLDNDSIASLFIKFCVGLPLFKQVRVFYYI